MLKRSFHIATLFGIPIRLNITLLLLAVYLGLRMGDSLMGLLMAALLVFSVTLHEVGHSLVAQHAGIRVREINLTIFGGMAVMDRMPRRPKTEMLLAVAGPAVSLTLGVLSILAWWAAATWTGMRFLPLALLGAINIVLGLFNLLPAFPMDGGRVLRALLTRRMGRLGATFVAVRIGNILALALGIFGLFRANLLLVLVAGVVFFLGNKEYQIERIRQMMNGNLGPEADNEAVFGDGNQVIVSPPPYEPDRKQRTPLYEYPDDMHEF